MPSQSEIKEAIVEYKSALARFRGEPVASATDIEYRDGWYVVSSSGRESRFRHKAILREAERIKEELAEIGVIKHQAKGIAEQSQGTNAGQFPTRPIRRKTEGGLGGQRIINRLGVIFCAAFAVTLSVYVFANMWYSTFGVESYSIPPSASSRNTNYRPSHSNGGNITLTRYSTGYDWQRADLQTKRRFCEIVAAAISKEFRREFSGDFFHDALDTFYESSDPALLKQNINEIIGLTTAAALGNPQINRSY